MHNNLYGDWGDIFSLYLLFYQNKNKFTFTKWSWPKILIRRNKLILTSFGNLYQDKDFLRKKIVRK